jgi:hypothetical protein
MCCSIRYDYRNLTLYLPKNMSGHGRPYFCHGNKTKIALCQDNSFCHVICVDTTSDYCFKPCKPWVYHITLHVGRCYDTRLHVGRWYDIRLHLARCNDITTYFQETSHVSWHGRGDYMAVVIPGGDSKSVVIHQLSKQRSQVSTKYNNYPNASSKSVLYTVILNDKKYHLLSQYLS